MRAEDTHILFVGTPSFASRILVNLYQFGFNIAGVITHPTKRSGRGHLIISSDVKETADKYSLLVFQPSSKDELIQIAKRVNPDIVVVAAYGEILPKDFLETPRFGSLNVHGSLLPKYRGSSPIPNAILNGDQETGVSIIKMTERLDAGPIVSQSKILIDSKDTTASLYEKLSIIGAEELARIIPLYIESKVKERLQDENKATYCDMIKKEFGLIDWRRSAVDIERTIRAFIPWPNAYTHWDDKLIKILDADVVQKALEPGYVVSVGKSFLVGCGQDSLEVKRLQLEAKNEMTVQEFMNGHREIDGVTLK